ncbi:MAG: DNRLRE domain-containing protein [Phycisphaerae bacterium]
MATLGLADCVSLTPVADNTLYEPFLGELSNGAGVHMFAGRSGGGFRQRGILRFDLASVPAGATIDSATLTLSMSRTIAADATISLHRCQTDWSEGSVVAGSGQGGGAPATPGSTTWRFATFDTVSWSNAGGDFATAASASALVGGIGTYSWSGAGVLTDVTNWYADPSTNFGWIILGNETAAATSKRFETRESPAPPILRIVFTPAIPCPGDLSGDRRVDEADLGILLGAWQTTAGGDADCDNDTDEADLGIVLANWQAVCP